MRKIRSLTRQLTPESQEFPLEEPESRSEKASCPSCPKELKPLEKKKTEIVRSRNRRSCPKLSGSRVARQTMGGGGVSCRRNLDGLPALKSGGKRARDRESQRAEPPSPACCSGWRLPPKLSQSHEKTDAWPPFALIGSWDSHRERQAAKTIRKRWGSCTKELNLEGGGAISVF